MLIRNTDKPFESMFVPTQAKRNSEDLGIFKFIDEVRNQGEGVCISDSMAVEVSVILARSEASILFLDKEERGSLGGFGWMDFPRVKVFVNELICGLSFFD